jgi:hypothetical protein
MLLPVAHERDRELRDVAVQLAQREAIREHLARVVQVAQPVDHRHLRARSELLDGFVDERSRHDDVDPQREVLADVGHRFAAPEPDVGRPR